MIHIIKVVVCALCFSEWERNTDWAEEAERKCKALLVSVKYSITLYSSFRK